MKNPTAEGLHVAVRVKLPSLIRVLSPKATLQIQFLVGKAAKMT